MEYKTILSLLKAMHEFNVRYAIVGGVALNFHGLARATADIDIFVSPEEENIAKLRQALKSIFHDPDIDTISSEDLAMAYPVIQYVPPEGTFHIDILARLGDMYSFKDIEAQEILVEGVPIRVATPDTLYRMKKDTVRLQDKADAERLKRHFKLKD